MAVDINEVGAAIGFAVNPVQMVDELVCTSDLAIFGPAIGLALAGLFEKDKIIQLASSKKIEEPAYSKKVRLILDHTGKWSVAAVFLLVLALWIHIGSIRSENYKMKTVLDQNKSSASPVARLEPKIKEQERMKKYRVDVMGVLIDISRALPENIIISSIQSAREQKLVVKGTSRDPKAVFTFTDTLRKSNRLSNVNLQRIEQGGRDNSFTISADMPGVQKLNTVFARGKR